MSMLEKIISGGQTGADQAGLEAGRKLGIQTGGAAPYNWMTAEGSAKELLESYRLVAGPYDSRTYPKRTRRNVEDSDGTVVFGNVSSPGCRLTIGLCIDLSKFHILNPSPEELRDWVRLHDIKTLNVAGNREHTNPGIYGKTLQVLLEAFSEVELT